MSSAPRRERYRALGLSAFAILLVASATLAVQAAASRAGASSTGPAFVQEASAHASGQSTISVVPSSEVTAGNRLVVEVGVWKSAGATTTSVTDSTSDPFVEVTHFVASDGAEMSVWTAPVRSGGIRPTISATPSTKADLGIVALEYSGLSTVADATVVDHVSHTSGVTTAAGSVNSTPTAPTTEPNELAVGFYADSGFGDTLAAGSGFTQRANVSPAGNIEMLAEDQSVPLGTTPAGSAQTGANTIWLMATVVFESSLEAVPQPPTNVSATPGNAAATVTWAAPPSGGSAITSYTVTPYVNGVAQTPTVVAGGPPPTSNVPGGLINGTTYTFTVTATNANGTSMPSAVSVPVTPNSEPQGQWGSLMTFPMVAISSILMDNGNFIFWDGWQQPEPTEVWNPGTPTTFTTIDAPDSVFCDGAAQLPDGRIIVIGGYGGLSTGQIGIVDTNIFDPATSTWTRVANMKLPRWYPTLTELPDGDYVAISGNSTDPNHWADTPEVYDPTSNTWTLLSKISTPQVHEEEYPFSYLIPNGNVLTIGPAEDVTYEINVGAQTWTPVGGQSGIRNGSSIQYLPGKILYSGGAASVITTKPAQATTAVLDTTAATPAWRQTAPMNDARVYHTLTMLANGQVLAVGGGTDSNQHVITTGVMPTEIWNPASETWSAGAPIAAARNYHSTAVLMPDGRVFVGGGGHPNGLNDPGQDSAQFYTPSYLFNGSRPTITSIPAATTYGSTISVTTPDASSITAVNLVSLGTDTHQMDMNQHFVPLSFTADTGGLNVTMPTSAAIAPPGHYMLFILNGQGTPSVAPILGLGPSTTPVAPSAPTGVTATAGDGTATVSWRAPANGGSPITSYTVTPSTGSTTLTPTVVTGTPPTTTATIGGLTDGLPYTFTVTATNGAGTGPPSTPSNTVTPSAPTAPGTPTEVTATAGDDTATVRWTAPANGGSPITSYTVTPSTSSTTLTPTVVTGTPPATTATISGLSDGVSYTFTVTATNAVGTGPPSGPSNTVTPTNTTVPAFVQQASKQVAAAKTVSVTPSAPLGAGNRLVVEVGVWNSTNATTASVTDSAGDTFTEVGHFTGSDKTEQSVWTAPITAGGSTEPAVTATFTSKAAGAIAALEYSGLSTAAGSGVVDEESGASGTTTTATSVSSGPTAATARANELAIGFYSDSGFKDTLSAGAGYIARAVVSNNANMELMAEDQLVAAGATPAASAGTGPNTIWEMATVVFEAGSAPANGTLLREVVASKQAAPEAPNDQATVHAVPGSPGRAEAVAGDRSATVRWAAPRGRGVVVSLYRVTPYLSGVAQPATMVSGSPPPASSDVTGLTNRHSYTFTVTAINALGTGPASPASRPVHPRAIARPRFVQRDSAHGASVSSIAVTTPRIVTDGDRLVVEVAVRNTNRATAANVTDSAGDTFTEVTSVAGADGTELSVWTAPVTQSGGTRPTITATPTSDADMGIVALEYAGLSRSSGPQAVDQSATASGRAPSARSVSSGSTVATTSPDELVVGFYADAPIAGSLGADPGYQARLDEPPASGMQLFVEDTVVGQGAEPAASVWTGARTDWEMATVVFQR
jgi:Domain of unknown function (DUF1929)/Fibronectin type III domain